MLLPCNRRWTASRGQLRSGQRCVKRGTCIATMFVADPPGTRWYHDHGFGFSFCARPLWSSHRRRSPRRACRPRIRARFSRRSEGGFSWKRRRSEGRARLRCRSRWIRPRWEIWRVLRWATKSRTRHLASTAPLIPTESGSRCRSASAGACVSSTRAQPRPVTFWLAGHELLVTHADGNPLQRSVAVGNVVRLGSGERYDALFEVGRLGAFLLQSGVERSALQAAQAVMLYTDGAWRARRRCMLPGMLDGLRVLTYELAGGVEPSGRRLRAQRRRTTNSCWPGRFSVQWALEHRRKALAADAQTSRAPRRTSDSALPQYEPNGSSDASARSATFSLTECNGAQLQRPLAKDVVLVPAGGTATLGFTAGSPPGRWLLHCPQRG